MVLSGLYNHFWVWGKLYVRDRTWENWQDAWENRENGKERETEDLLYSRAYVVDTGKAFLWLLSKGDYLNYFKSYSLNWCQPVSI